MTQNYKKKRCNAVNFRLLILAGISMLLCISVANAQTNATIRINASADNFIDDDQKTSNFGTSDVLVIGNQGVGPTGSMIIFNQSDLSTIPNSSSIISATISLLVNHESADGGHNITFYPIISKNWLEINANWNKNDSLNNWNSAGLMQGNDVQIFTQTQNLSCSNSDGQWCVFNVTPIVQSWVSGTIPNYGIFFFRPNETSGGHDLQFRSKDHVSNLTPHINITYSESTNLTEAEAQPVILQAINNIIPNSTKYNYQQVYLVNASGNQTYATWDYYVLYNSKRWAINYVTGNEQFVQSANLTPSVYVLETANLPSTALRIQVETFLNTTLNT